MKFNKKVLIVLLIIMEVLVLLDVSMYYFCKCYIYLEFVVRIDWVFFDFLKMIWLVGIGYFYYILVLF